ncbi:ABC transporter permease [Deinococcus marmoris]|uniref:Dipeptide transport system permease protein DppC n=1 Tax=Deinococcus marmoris TaxID=249408 RepID=A0A1U7NR39_9DEIO|nr:ABC transporter permease [Deinococcus marmoris]OLV15381.1 Dipeptide transport system permease protein DppC [Deinococcus marmoris]
MTVTGTVALEPRRASGWALIRQRFLKHRLATVSLVILALLILLSVFAPLIAPYSPSQIDATNVYAASNSEHLMGTDALGRDIFSRLLYAGRISLLVGFVVTILSALIGTGLGLLAGFYSGQPLLAAVGPFSPQWAGARHTEGRSFWPKTIIRWLVWAALIAFVIRATGQFASVADGVFVTVTWVIGVALAALIFYFTFIRSIRLDIDSVISRMIDIFLAIPTLPFLLVLAGLFSNPKIGLGVTLDQWLGPARSVTVIIFVLTLFGWLSMARIVRGTILNLRNAEFNEAAIGLGASDARVILRHLLPNAVAPIFVQITLDLGHAIVAEAALSFLGLGIQEPTASWGNILNGAQEAIFQQPTAVFWPGLFILLTTLSTNYIGDGLRDAIDPRSRG